MPFEAKGTSVSLALEAASGRLTVGLPLQNVSPAIFVDPEGTPLIMDAETGVLLDANKPARANTRVQVLATGFGRVTAGLAHWHGRAAGDPPRVVATVHAYLDGMPLEVTQATLAPGYVGFYLIEIQLPQVVNTGSRGVGARGGGTAKQSGAAVRQRNPSCSRPCSPLPGGGC